MNEKCSTLSFDYINGARWVLDNMINMTNKERLLFEVLVTAIQSSPTVGNSIGKIVDVVKVESIEGFDLYPKEADCSDWEKWTNGKPLLL